MFMLFRKREKPAAAKREIPYQPERPQLFWGQVANEALSDGITPDKRRLFTVKLSEGRTRDDLIAFLSMIRPCPAWDALVAAESRGIVQIGNSGRPYIGDERKS